MRNKTTEVTEGHREGVFGIAEYVHEKVAFVQVNYAQFLCEAQREDTAVDYDAAPLASTDSLK